MLDRRDDPDDFDRFSSSNFAAVVDWFRWLILKNWEFNLMTNGIAFGPEVLGQDFINDCNSWSAGLSCFRGGKGPATQ